LSTDTSEKGLESLIVAALTGTEPTAPAGTEIRERPTIYGAGWILGDARDYNREYAVDLVQLAAFLHDKQPRAAEALAMAEGVEAET
jgi:type I restriction enzyme, R subunit